MRVSVVVSSWRPGGLDITFAGLTEQTHPDFEILFVDHRRLTRVDLVAQKARDYQLPNFYHLPEHYCDKFFHAPAAWNTGLLCAEGDITIMLQDYAYAPPGWIEAHERSHAYRTPTFCLGPYCHLRIPEDRMPYKTEDETALGYSSVEEPESVKGSYGEFSIFDEPFRADWIPRLQIQEPPDQDPKWVDHFRRGIIARGPVMWWYCHGKNCSFPTEIALKVGGVDETFQKGKGPWDNEFSFRFMQAGCTIWFEPDAISYHLDPRRFMRTMPWGDMEESLAGRWSYADGYRYQNQRYAEMLPKGQTIQVHDEVITGLGTHLPVANNPYDFMEKRKELLAQKAKWRVI